MIEHTDPRVKTALTHYPRAARCRAPGRCGAGGRGPLGSPRAGGQPLQVQARGAGHQAGRQRALRGDGHAVHAPGSPLPARTLCAQGMHKRSRGGKGGSIWTSAQVVAEGTASVASIPPGGRLPLQQVHGDDAPRCTLQVLQFARCYEAAAESVWCFGAGRHVTGPI